jgi:hypothetical protein
MEEGLAMSEQTTIVLKSGLAKAEVVLEKDGAKVTHLLPIGDILDILARGVMNEDGGTGGNDHLATAARVVDPLAWKVNLFPELPYALFESKGNLEIAVRGFEACTKMLMWRQDSDRRDKPTSLAFRIPRVLWVCAWRNKKLIKAWCYTADTWPANVVDSTALLHPWGAGNVWERGEVCWGSTSAPYFGADGVGNVASTFFGSIFNDHIPNLNVLDKYKKPGAFRNGFTLLGLFEQTTEGLTEKVGVIPHATGHQVTLRQLIQTAAAE